MWFRPRGYEGLTDHMMKELPRDIVLYNKPVKCIHWNYTKNGPNTGGTSFPVTIECVNGETFAADHVIVTVPLGMYSRISLNSLLRELFASITHLY